MKNTFMLPLLLAMPALAGTTSKEVIAPAHSEPSLWSWFTGASGGYLTEFEEPMYHVHVGADSPWNIGGWDVALFGEIGYTEKSISGGGRQPTPGVTAIDYGDDDWDDDYDDEFYLGESSKFSLSEIEDAIRFSPTRVRLKLRIIPVTANVKFERALTGNLNAYVGAGLGMANVDLSIRSGFGNYSDDDWVFCAQAFAGLVYNVSPAFEIYGGGRWMYFDDAKFSSNGASATLDLEDDFLAELGFRYNF